MRALGLKGPRAPASPSWGTVPEAYSRSHPQLLPVSPHPIPLLLLPEVFSQTDMLHPSPASGSALGTPHLRQLLLQCHHLHLFPGTRATAQYSSPRALLLHLALRPGEPEADGAKDERERRARAALARLWLGAPSSSGELVRRWGKAGPICPSCDAETRSQGRPRAGGRGLLHWGGHSGLRTYNTSGPGRLGKAIQRQHALPSWLKERCLHRGRRGQRSLARPPLAPQGQLIP